MGGVVALSSNSSVATAPRGGEEGDEDDMFTRVWWLRSARANDEANSIFISRYRAMGLKDRKPEIHKLTMVIN